MNTRRKYLSWVWPVLLAVLVAGLVQYKHSRGTLWRIVSEQCVPAAQAGQASRCAEVALSGGIQGGDVVFKDRRGALQFLLMPTRQMSGIEDPRLLARDAPPYFQHAWQARRWMDAVRGKPVPREDVSIAINSAWSRSQDQLHLHISCVRADLKAYLRTVEPQIGQQWASLPGGWQGHRYFVRRVVGPTLEGLDPVRDVAASIGGAVDEMGRHAIAVIGTRFADGHDGFWWLATRVDPWSGWLGGIEGDVQDHDCRVLAQALRDPVRRTASPTSPAANSAAVAGSGTGRMTA